MGITGIRIGRCICIRTDVYNVAVQGLIEGDVVADNADNSRHIIIQWCKHVLGLIAPRHGEVFQRHVVETGIVHRDLCSRLR